MTSKKQEPYEIANEALSKANNSCVQMLARMWELEQGEYLCIGWRENMKDGFDVYKTQFVLLEHARVEKEVL
jgi:hypothetical protein